MTNRNGIQMILPSVEHSKTYKGRPTYPPVTDRKIGGVNCLCPQMMEQELAEGGK